MYTIKYTNPALMGDVITNTFETEEKLKSFLCWLITVYAIGDLVVMEITKQ